MVVSQAGSAARGAPAWRRLPAADMPPEPCRRRKSIGRWVNTIEPQPVGARGVDQSIVGSHAVVPVETRGAPTATQAGAVVVQPQSLVDLVALGKVVRRGHPGSAAIVLVVPVLDIRHVPHEFGESVLRRRRSSVCGE